MWNYENYDIPFIEHTLKEYRSELDKLIAKKKFWNWAYGLSLVAAIMFAILTIVVTLTTKYYWLTGISLACIILTFSFAFFSLRRWREWGSQAMLLCQLARPMESDLVKAYEAQNISSKEN